MPTLSVFFGIIIRMYFKDHPPPHFHAIYGEHEAKIAIATLELIEGQLYKSGDVEAECQEATAEA